MAVGIDDTRFDGGFKESFANCGEEDLMSTKQQIKERVLNVFNVSFHNGLMAEEVFPLYEELYGATSRSNSIHTTLSQLTKEGHLIVVGKKTSPITHKTVNVWNLNDRSAAPVVKQLELKLTGKQLQDELNMLRLKNKTLEVTNLHLLGVIEHVRAELQTEVERQVGAGL
jgi:hypothetical protein